MALYQAFWAHAGGFIELQWKQLQGDVAGPCVRPYWHHDLFPSFFGGGEALCFCRRCHFGVAVPFVRYAEPEREDPRVDCGQASPGEEQIQAVLDLF